MGSSEGTKIGDDGSEGRVELHHGLEEHACTHDDLLYNIWFIKRLKPDHQ